MVGGANWREGGREKETKRRESEIGETGSHWGTTKETRREKKAKPTEGRGRVGEMNNFFIIHCYFFKVFRFYSIPSWSRTLDAMAHTGRSYPSYCCMKQIATWSLAPPPRGRKPSDRRATPRGVSPVPSYTPVPEWKETFFFLKKKNRVERDNVEWSFSSNKKIWG